VVTIQLFFADVISNRLRSSIAKLDNWLSPSNRLRQFNLWITDAHLLSAENIGVSFEKNRRQAIFSSRMHRTAYKHFQVSSLLSVIDKNIFSKCTYYREV